MRIILSIAAVAVFAFSLTQWASLPIVYVSWSEKTCVRVESSDPKHSCENLPNKYEHVWVK